MRWNRPISMLLELLRGLVNSVVATIASRASDRNMLLSFRVTWYNPASNVFKSVYGPATIGTCAYNWRSVSSTSATFNRPNIIAGGNAKRRKKWNTSENVYSEG